MAEQVKDLALSQQQLRPLLWIQVQSLAWELLHAASTAKKKGKQNKIQKVVLEFPLWLRGLRIQLVFMMMWVRALALLNELRVLVLLQAGVSVSHRHSLDLPLDQ